MAQGPEKDREPNKVCKIKGDIFKRVQSMKITLTLKMDTKC